MPVNGMSGSRPPLIGMSGGNGLSISVMSIGDLQALTVWSPVVAVKMGLMLHGS